MDIGQVFNTTLFVDNFPFNTKNQKNENVQRKISYFQITHSSQHSSSINISPYRLLLKGRYINLIVYALPVKILSHE